MCFIFFGSNLSYAAVFTLLVIGLPVFVIIACFVRVKLLIEMNKRIKSFTSVTSIVSEEIDSAKTLFSVVIMVLLCWFPILLIFLPAAVGIDIPRQASLMSTFSIFLTCALKPVIYFCMRRQFRTGFLLPDLFKRRRRNRVAHKSIVRNCAVNRQTSRIHNERPDQFKLKQESAEFEETRKI